MIICGLPNEERAQKKIQDIALYIINQKTKGRGPKSACRQTSKSLVHTQCITERQVRASRVTGYPSSQRVCICGSCRAWPARLICDMGKGNGPWSTTLEKMMLIVTSCWWDKASCLVHGKVRPWSTAGGTSALGEGLMQTAIFQFQNADRFGKSVPHLQVFQ